MERNILVAPSILSADFSELGVEIKAIESAGADWVHIDVMDGAFVPNITIGPLIVKAIRPLTKMFFDVHLMIQDPGKYVDVFADSGSDLITFHIEACKAPLETIDKIRAKGKKVGVSIKPGTGVSALEGVLDKVDMVLVMTVEPGFGGQSFMEDMLPKIKALREKFEGDIQVDGGISKDTASKVIEAGANILVAGSAVFRQDDYARAISEIRGQGSK